MYSRLAYCMNRNFKLNYESLLKHLDNGGLFLEDFLEGVGYVPRTFFYVASQVTKNSFYRNNKLVCAPPSEDLFFVGTKKSKTIMNFLDKSKISVRFDDIFRSFSQGGCGKPKVKLNKIIFEECMKMHQMTQKNLVSHFSEKGVRITEGHLSNCLNVDNNKGLGVQLIQLIFNFLRDDRIFIIKY